MSLIHLHVIPIGDLSATGFPHVASRGCWCGPRVETQDNGADLVVHNAHDQRERLERRGLALSAGWMTVGEQRV